MEFTISINNKAAGVPLKLTVLRHKHAPSGGGGMERTVACIEQFTGQYLNTIETLKSGLVVFYSPLCLSQA